MKTIVIASGYFNPIHKGHIHMLQGSKQLGDYLITIVNNDKQQILKKGKIIMDQDERAEIVEAIKYVDEVLISIDTDSSVTNTLETIAQRYEGQDVQLIFANGGDRSSSARVPEAGVCERYNIKTVYDAGSTVKENSSSSINKKLGRE